MVKLGLRSIVGKGATIYVEREMNFGSGTKEFTVDCDGDFIPVVLTRKRVKNINLRIRCNQSVAVSAASHVPLKAIEELIRGKAAWILKHFDRYAHQQKDRVVLFYENGDQLNYLGRTYTLQVQEAIQREEVLADQDKIYLLIRANRSREYRDKMIDRWYREKAGYILNQSLEKNYPLLAGHKIAKPALVIRKMKTRWGSCSLHKQKITLNLELVKMPPALIDYVVLHELVHFIHQNHSKAFYDCLSGLMPDWKERRKLLKEKGILG